MIIPFEKTRFLKSVIDLKRLPPDIGTEIAFAGRSNAGKSSALNAITGIKHLAKTSKIPGRTQMINLFEIDGHKRLADLPGYGYAKAPLHLKLQWEKVLNAYFHTRACLRGFCLIMDIRHPLKTLDQTMLGWAVHAGLAAHILLTKSDKFSSGKAAGVLQQIQKKLMLLYPDSLLISCQTFSSLNGSGILEARKKISQWLV